MSIEVNKAFIRRQVEDVWNSGNADAIATYWENELGVEMEHSHTMLHSAFPDLKVSVVDMIAENDKVVARLLFEGTQKGPFMGIPPTGKKVEWEAMRIWRLANGKIVETWAIRDRLDVREIFGVIPSHARGNMKNQTSLSSRATTIEELEIVLSKFFDETKTPLGLAFKPYPSDIIISPYTKCGTTWLQQITHGLRKRGSMDFDEINDVVPWIEAAYDVGWDLDAAQVATPRLYKSHVSWIDIPKGCRYICSFRHPHDALISFYRFFEDWMFEAGTISLETLTHWRWPRDKADSQGYFYHLVSWWEQRHNKDVLLLCYEDMMADLPGTVQRIAHFMEIDLDDALLDIVVRQSSREFMLAHKHQFDEHILREIGEKRAGLPPAIDASKVTPGNSNHPRHKLSPGLKKELDDIWREQIQSKFGFENYVEFRQALKEQS